MRLFIESFFRALSYVLHVRLIGLSLLPLLILSVLGFMFGQWAWAPAVDMVRNYLESVDWIQLLVHYLELLGVGNLSPVLSTLVIIFLVTPLLVVISLWVSWALMGPSLYSWVARRRFPELKKLHGGSLAGSLVWGLRSSCWAMLWLLLGLPLWSIPPFMFLLPPLIWGWLTYRLMAYDCLAEHASADERDWILNRYRLALWMIGCCTGLMGTLPGLIWLSGAMVAAAFIVLLPLALWLYALVFGFSALWFSHFCLAALQKKRDFGSDLLETV
jgi:hypothetical protein